MAIVEEGAGQKASAGRRQLSEHGGVIIVRERRSAVAAKVRPSWREAYHSSQVHHRYQSGSSMKNEMKELDADCRLHDGAKYGVRDINIGMWLILIRQ